MVSPSVEASGLRGVGRLLIRLASRSRHRRDSAMSQRYPSVDAYLRRAPAFAQPIIEHLREVVHAACPEVEECITWTCPFFVYRGPVCAVAAFKAHCRIGFWKADVLRKGPAAAAAHADKPSGRSPALYRRR